MKDFRFRLDAQPPLLGAGVEPEQDETLDWGENEWGTHRYHIRRLIEDTLSNMGTQEKAVVLGAGNHGDVDLPALAKQFQSLTVLDSEDNLLEEWIEKESGSWTQRMKSLTRVDYTRLDQISFYERYEEMLAAGAPATELARSIREAAFEVRRLEAVPHLKKSFSLVVSSGVHTQLFYLYALSALHEYAHQYNEEQTRQMVEALNALRSSLITDYDQMLLSLLKSEGRMVMWTDVVLVDESKQELLAELEMKTTEKDRTTYLFSLFGRYGMEPAVQGLKNLHDRLRPDQLLFRSWSWHTESGKTYLAAGISGIPK